MNYIYVAAFTANVISFIAATSLTWTSPILSKLKNETDTPFSSPLSEDEASWVSSLLPLGAVFGPFVYGFLADWIGRKLSLMICGVPFLLSYLALAFGKAPWIYYAARFLIGTSVGGVFTVIPMYVGEIAQDSNRGALGSSMNCFLCTGLLFSYAVGPYVSILVFNLILAVFPVIFLVLFFLLAPESPHFYAIKERNADAKTALHKIRSGGNEVIEEELNEMHAKIKEDGHANFFDIFRSKGLTKAFFISVGLIAFQQFSGINVVLFFAQILFEQAGTTLEPEICSIIIGCTQFITSFVTPLVVDRLGRKILLLISAVGMAISEFPLGLYSYLKDDNKDVSSISFLPILCLIGYIITYNSAFGPLPWAMMGELFPANVKSSASAVTSAFCWFLGFLITKYFQSISDSIGMGPSFWIFASCCVVAIPFSFLYVIETKGKSLKEIQTILSS
ncbi:facilitated trehalose transporter Tret1-like [Anoplophora glabripennis]|uniref:facilitated trehalose transporter Tret1-like n=1 Tax=Anoplophora glabripennis TaxID=217634 RepID=UPI0008735666|nr:facilitated trehalose transporter Tret1-like [Anoplophora glabripennis]